MFVGPFQSMFPFLVESVSLESVFSRITHHRILGIHERVRGTNLPKTARHGWFQRIPIVSHSTARRFVKAFARRDVPLHGNSRLTNASSN